MKTKTTFFKKACVVIACFVPMLVFGQIEISNEAQLRAIADDLSGSYKLVNDIALSGEWTPIGDEEARFTGTIDGNGKTISGLKFEDSTRNGAGFIGVAEGATIQNLKIVGARIYGGQDVGIVVGRAYAPTVVEVCYTSGVVSGYDHVAGIIGGSKSTDSDGYNAVDDCYSTAAVVSTSWQAGGIVGTSIDINITNTYFAGVAICSAGRTGGIVALADGGNTDVRNSVVMAAYLKGDEANRIMGSTGSNSVSLSDNYSSENTLVYVKDVLYEDGIDDAYDVDGQHTDEATLKTADFYKNTLLWSESIWKIADGSYPVFADQTYPLNADAIYVALFPERALPETEFATNAVSALGRTVTMTSSNPAVATIDADGLVSFIANGNTTLTFTTQGDAYSAGASFTYELEVKGIAYNITTEEDLRAMKYDLEGEFTLMNNITLTKDWEPIGTFKGKLNGNGKIIYGLKVNDKEMPRKGLFSETEGAEITKLGIEQANILGNEDIGAIVGNMKGGLIDQCYVADSYIAGRDHIGSIVGAMRSYEEVTTPGDPDNGIEEVKERRYATVSNCHAGAQIYSREFQAGGIAGIICGGTLEKCYFSGQVHSLKGRAAGIVSLVDSDDPGEVINNVNLAVAGYCNENSLRIGDFGTRTTTLFDNNWSKEKSYFGVSLEKSATKTGDGTTGMDGATVSNDNLTLSKDFYETTLGWDFGTTWKFISGTEGKMYPVLAWQQSPVVVNVYGIPNPAFLTWYMGSAEAITLNKIQATGGQKLEFKIEEGAEFADLEITTEDSYLYVTEGQLSDGGWVKVSLKVEDALTSAVTLKTNYFDVEVILRDAYTNINSVDEFLAINNKLFGKFRLMQNIDMTGVDFEGIGSVEVPFTGELNGNGFSIINPVVKTNGDNKKGLFNATKGATIQKLGVLNFSFEGSTKDKGADLGGLVGSCNTTTIDQCYITGNIVGNDHIGGFVGGDCDMVTITNSYADVTITAGSQAGGFFGVTAGTVTVRNCYFAGTINAMNRGWAGGIIGLIDRVGDISISNTVSIGDVISPEYAGSHIGGNIKDDGIPRGTVKLFLDNLSNMDALIESPNLGWDVSEVEVPSENVVSAQFKTADDFMKKATYTAIGWDFDNIWTIVEGVSYPKLKAVPTGLSELLGDEEAGKYIVYTSGNDIYVFGIENEAQVSIYNVNGQLLSQKVITNNTAMPVANKGFYLLTITENGKTSPVKVICK